MPLLVDCDPVTLNMDLDDAERKLADLAAGRTPLKRDLPVVGIIPVHVGGLMVDVAGVEALARASRVVGGRGRGPCVPRRLASRACRALAALRREYGGRKLLLLLRQQDHHHRRRRHGGDRRSTPGRPHAANVAPRPVARRLEALRRELVLGLPHRGPGIQVQPERHRRRAGQRAACAGRNHAAGNGKRLPSISAPPWPAWNRSSCLPRSRTASMPGTCFPSVCGWSGLGSTGTASWSCCAGGGSVVRSTGGRCTCTRTTRNRSAGNRTICRKPPGNGRD